MSGRRPSRVLFLTGKGGGQKKYKENEGQKQISTIEKCAKSCYKFVKLLKKKTFDMYYAVHTHSYSDKLTCLITLSKVDAQ